MQLTFHGGVGSVTGANYLIEHDGYKLLVECGLLQGANYCENPNFDDFPYNPADIAAVAVTHAHIDHTGLLPKLVNRGFGGAIHSTAPTKDFAELLLLDSENILNREAERCGVDPLYNEKDITRTLAQWRTHGYGESVNAGPFTITFYDAGHIIGSACIVVEAGGKKLLFSGDLGNIENPILPEKASLANIQPDYALMESTYGNRTHEPTDERADKLKAFIKKVINRGGTLLIPAFALERTQQLLLELNDLVENAEIPPVPIYLDSPLAIKLTSVYQKYKNLFRPEIQKQIASGDDIFDFPGLHTTLTRAESIEINNHREPKIIIAGAGMSHGGRIQYHEMRYLPDAKSGIVFIGYQSEGSLGRAIADGAKQVTIYGDDIPVNAEVHAVSGYSAHADRDELIRWANDLEGNLKKLFIVQGDPPAAEALAEKLQQQGLPAVLPKKGSTVEL